MKHHRIPYFNILLTVSCIALSIFLCCQPDLAEYLETETYCLFGLCFFCWLAMIGSKMDRKAHRVITGALSALVFTAGIILYNNLLHRYEWYQILPHTNYPYWEFLWEDLTYSVGWGALRYPGLLLLMLICFLLAVNAKILLAKIKELPFVKQLTHRLRIIFIGDETDDYDEFEEMIRYFGKDESVTEHSAETLRPYTGSQPYIFISYAHKDSTHVIPIIRRMQEDGFRVWYDEGIDPGTEWDETIAKHVENCSYFIAFMSRNYLDSNNCKDELNFARDLEKTRLIVYLEYTELPSGMAMRLNRQQAIHKYNKYKYHTDAEFFDTLYNASEIHITRASRAAESYPEELSFTDDRPSDTTKYDVIDYAAAFLSPDEPINFVNAYGTNFTLKKKLLHAMTTALTDRDIAYVSVQAEQFTNELIDSIRSGTSAKFHERYETTQYLILDDLEILCGKTATQEELYTILRSRYYNDRPTFVFTTKQPDTSELDYRLTQLISEWHCTPLH